jgi:nitrilase
MSERSVFSASVVQMTPALLDKAQTLEKVLFFIREASREKSTLLLFPEVIIPGYPRGLNFGATVGSRTSEGRDLFFRYWNNSIEVPGPETELLAKAAKQARIYLVIGVTEKDSVSDTLYCSLLYFSPQGELIQKHRKLKPTGTERVIWGEGDGSDLQVVDSSIGKIGGLICWENYMPLARTALYQQGIEIYLAPTADSRATWQSTLQHIACEGRCFVLGCNQYLTPAHLPPDLTDEYHPEAFSQSTMGGSCIISPFGQYVAGPLYDKEGILTCIIDHREVIRAKMDFDPIGHYARPDVFDFNWKVGPTKDRKH